MIGETAIPASLQQFGVDARQQAEATTKTDELGQDEFLTLMLAQVKHQDPMEPMDNGEFISELAEFSTVSGIEEMNQSMQALAESYGSAQTLSSAQLVGREVLIESEQLMLEDGADTGGRFDLEYTSGDVTVLVKDASGQLVREIPLGLHAAGRHDFTWDGLDQQGERMAAGAYSVSVEAASGDERLAIPMLAARRVDSVEFGAGGETLLHDTTGESFTLDAVRQIRQERTPDNTETGTDA